MTSGNLSDEPIAYRDDDAGQRLAPIADGILSHNRAIHMRCDDSVARIAAGGEQLFRRSRGYAPGADLAAASSRPVPLLACGGHLKEHILPRSRGGRRSSATTSATWKTWRR